MSFSVIVCTRNRAGKLTASLDAIVAAMKAAPQVKAELIVVDNGSTDETPDVLLAWMKGQKLYTFAVHAPEPGLSRARNAGLAHASGDVIVMTDDDCVMAPDYLVEASRLHTSPAVIGGRVVLGDPADLPVSIRLGDEPQVYDGRRKASGFVIGANLSFHRSISEKLGGFDERFGAGARFPAAEDSDFIFRAFLAGYPVRFQPELVVAHFHGRRDKAVTDALVAGYSLSEGALYAKHLMTGRPLRYLLQYARARRWRDLYFIARGMIA